MHSIFVFTLLFFNQFSYSSFAPETLVRTPHGFVLISDLQLDQTIVSYDELKQSFVVGAVRDSYSYQTTHAYRVTCDDDTSFITTAEQRIILYESHTWRRVKDLMIGDRLLCRGNGFVAVSAIELLVDKISLWHVAVAPYHTFCVTFSGIIVHNSPAIVISAAPIIVPVIAKTAGVVATIGAMLWHVLSKKKDGNKNRFIQDSSFSGGSSPSPKKPNDEDEFRQKHPHGRYEDVGYHKNHQSGRKSPRPIDGQTALDNSFGIPGKERTRIGFSQGQFVVLNETVEGVYHGHVRVWDELRPVMQNILKDLGIVTKRGKFIK